MRNVNALLGASAFVPPGVILMAAPNIEDLRARQQELLDASQAIVDKADEEERDLTDEEIEKIEANKAEVDKVGKQLAAREAAAKPAAQGQGRRSAPEPVSNRNEPSQGQRGRTVPATPRDPRGGFATIGDFAQAVHRSIIQGNVDERIRAAAPSTYSSEGSGADGG